jgi:hypothetical protein
MLSILRDVNAAMSDSQKANLTWDFSNITMNSPMTADLFPIATEGRDIGQGVVTACANGLRSIEMSDDVVPQFFQMSTLRHARSVVGVLHDGIGKIEVETPYTPTIALTVQLAIHAEMMSRESYSDYGTFEGILETASIREGTNLTIRDQIYGHIPCHFPESLTECVRLLWTNRVSVFGVTTYNRSGIPKSIKVERIERLRSAAELPQWEDLKAINPGIIDTDTKFDSSVRNLLGNIYMSTGTFRGRLEAVNLHTNPSSAYIYPVIGPSKVRCTFTKGRFGNIGDYLDRFVEVVGVLKFRENEPHPFAIDVEEITPIGGAHIPIDLTNLIGLMPNITMGADVMEYLGDIRHEPTA